MIMRTWMAVSGLLLSCILHAAEHSESVWKVSNSAVVQQEPQYIHSRGIHKLYHEQTLERKLKTLFACNKHMKYDSDLTVTVYRSSVIVIGRVSQEEDLQIVHDVLKHRVPHLTQELFITVADITEGAVSHSKDQLLRLKVRAKLLKECGWVAGQIRVVVYQQNVYLIGPISQNVKNIMGKLNSMANSVTVIDRN